MQMEFALYILKFLVTNHMILFPLPGDSRCSIAFVAKWGSQFYLGAMFGSLVHI